MAEIAQLKLQIEKLEITNRNLVTSNKDYLDTISKDSEEIDACNAKKAMWTFLALFFMLSTLVLIAFNIIRA